MQTRMFGHDTPSAIALGNDHDCTYGFSFCARACAGCGEEPLGATGKINKLALREMFKDYTLPTATAAE